MKTRTFIFSAAITIFLLFFLILPGQPLSAEMPGEVRIFLNGKELLSDAPFLIEQGRTLVPVRVLLEAMGAEVDWDEEERRVYIYLDDLNIKLAAEANTFYINDRAVPLGMPARIIGGRVYIPLRTVCEMIGAALFWDGESRTVFIDFEEAFFDSELIPQVEPDYYDYYKDLDFNVETYGIILGDTAEDVLKLLGEPARKDATIYGYSWWVYNGDPFNYLLLGIQDGRVVAIYTCGEKWSFGPVKPGSALNELNNHFTLANVMYVEEKRTFYKMHLPTLIYDRVMVTFYYDSLENNKIKAIRLEDKNVAGNRYTLFFQYRSAQGEKEPYNPQRMKEAEASDERQLFDLANVERARRGEPLFSWHQPAAQAALEHSREMFIYDYFSHVSPVTGKTLDRRLDDQGIDFRLAAENLARGQLDAIEAHHGLMNSSGHRGNILNSDLRALGVGVYRDCYTQNFVTER